MCVKHVAIYCGPSDAGSWVTAVTFPMFKSLDNLTLPTAGETEESRISCIMVIELVPKKRHCIAHQKGLPPILVILVPLFCEMWVSCSIFQDPAPHYPVPPLWFCLTASLAPLALLVSVLEAARVSVLVFSCLQGLIWGSSPQSLPNIIHGWGAFSGGLYLLQMLHFRICETESVSSHRGDN